MSKNKLYNQGYFIKRLVDAGFDVTRLNIRFEENDSRRWMILVNSRETSYRYNICITCFKSKDSSPEDFMFKFQGQRNNDFSLCTKSMNTIILFLKRVFD